jgi:hypothetical protein
VGLRPVLAGRRRRPYLPRSRRGAAARAHFVRNTEGSGSNKVTFAPIELKEGKAISRIERKVAGIGTADIADYALAVAIPRKDLTAVEVWVDKKQREVLKVNAK